MDRSSHVRGPVPEVSPLDLARELETGEPLQIVDTRAPAQVAAGRIEPVPPGRYHTIPGSHVLGAVAPDGLGLVPGIPVAVVCGHGNSSVPVTAHLARLGVPARSLRGGMAAWMALVVAREIEPPAGLDRLLQMDRVGKGALGYLLVSDGEALIVDPPREPAAYLDAAREAGARVVGVADTHVHADYISGAPALARELGVPYHLHPRDSSYAYDGTPGRLAFHAVDDGDEIRFGRCTVRVRHTPGHTEGSVTYLVEEAAALTGDFLFVDSIGRPDLAGKTREWTETLWESVTLAKREWPESLLVLPAHYASESERRPDRAVAAPFGSLLGRNEALTIAGREDFRRWVESRTAPFPEAYRVIKAVNVGLREVGEREAEELETGRNECALSRAPER